MRLVYYSLFTPLDGPRPDILWQLEESVRTLRLYNTNVSIAVFTFGQVPPELASILETYEVKLYHRGSYQSILAQLSPRGWQILSQYPVLHKFLNFREIMALNPEQVLYLDCDTLFFGDVDSLFSRYTEADCYAREEPTCSRSHYGYNPVYLDESALASLGEHVPFTIPPPFNLGAVLLNRGLWHKLEALQPVFLSYAWRFAVWMASNPVQGEASSYGEGHGVTYLRQYFDQLADEEDVSRALPYPSSNRWILEQVAVWLTMGHVEGLRCDDFSMQDVLQNGEIFAHSHQNPGCVLCHYFSQNTQRVVDWMNPSSKEGPLQPAD